MVVPWQAGPHHSAGRSNVGGRRGELWLPALCLWTAVTDLWLQ